MSLSSAQWLRHLPSLLAAACCEACGLPCSGAPQHRKQGSAPCGSSQVIPLSRDVTTVQHSGPPVWFVGGARGSELSFRFAQRSPHITPFLRPSQLGLHVYTIQGVNMAKVLQISNDEIIRNGMSHSYTTIA